MTGIRETTAFLDSLGVMHMTKDAALAAELERAIGKIGNGEGLTSGIAKLLIDNRDRIVELLNAFGPMSVDAAV